MKKEHGLAWKWCLDMQWACSFHGWILVCWPYPMATPLGRQLQGLFAMEPKYQKCILGLEWLLLVPWKRKTKYYGRIMETSKETLISSWIIWILPLKLWLTSLVFIELHNVVTFFHKCPASEGINANLSLYLSLKTVSPNTTILLSGPGNLTFFMVSLQLESVVGCVSCCMSS